MPKQLLGCICLAAAASIWGGMFVAVRIAVEYIPPVPLVWMRFLVAIFVLLGAAWYQGVSLKAARCDLPLLIAVGVIGHTISIVTQEYGTMYSSAQMGSVITSATPAFMLIFAAWLLKERLTARKILAIILATVGVITIAGADSVDMTKQLGALFSTIAALTWGLMSVLLKKIPGRYSPLVVNIYAVITAIICLTPFNIATVDELPWREIADSPAVIASVIYLGAISTSVAFLLWNKGVLLTNAAVSGLFFFFQPVVGTFLGWLMLGEQITMSFWIGSAMIFAGVFLVTVRSH